MNKKVKGAYRKRYKMRGLGTEGLNTVVSIPRVVIEREAEKSGLTIEGFREQYRAVAQFNNFEGVHYTFEKIEDEPQMPAKLTEETQ